MRSQSRSPYRDTDQRGTEQRDTMRGTEQRDTMRSTRSAYTKVAHNIVQESIRNTDITETPFTFGMEWEPGAYGL